MDTILERTCFVTMGIKNYKSHQLKALEELNRLKDVLVILPTGHGKSLIYQSAPYLPVFRNTTCKVICVMPIISLMIEQMDKMNAVGLQTRYVKTIEELKANHSVTFFLMSPEFLTGSMREYLQGVGKDMAETIKLVCVDESHCVVKWGEQHGKSAAFRRHYSEIKEMRCLLPHATVLAMTATATTQLQYEITDSLALISPIIISLPPERLNIRYSVVPYSDNEVEESFNWLIDVLKEKQHHTPRMIIFCRLLKHVGALYSYVSGMLGANAHLIQMYHRSTPDSIQQDILTAFKDSSSTLRVVICSSSFSMGLDLPALYHVIHYGPPADITDLLQETGRVARDDQQGYSIIIKHRDSLKGQNISKEVKEFCKAGTCKREVLARAFGYVPSRVVISKCCSSCDITGTGASFIEDKIRQSFVTESDVSVSSDSVSTSSDSSVQDIDDFLAEVI